MRIAELTPVYRKTNHPSWSLSRLASSGDIFSFCENVVYSDANGMDYDEKCYAIHLNNNLRVVAFHKISEGGLNETLVDVRKVLQGALLSNASLMVLIHNHPSGSVRPSKDDDRLTERIKKACDIMQIKLLDHVVVADGGYYSYNDEGRL